jgi:Flp pilus assembly protein TadG
MGKAVLIMNRWKKILANEGGAAAIEFSIVGPVFLLMMIGAAYSCMLMFAQSSLQYAVEAGARCASVQTTVCTSGTAITTFAQNAYNGPLISPTFTYATAACGHQVNSSVNFGFNLGFWNATIPLSATACYP